MLSILTADCLKNAVNTLLRCIRLMTLSHTINEHNYSSTGGGGVVLTKHARSTVAILVLGET